MKKLIAIAALLGVTCGANAAGPPTYKCVDGKKITYSDEPCVGATVVDTTPTRGLDKSSGITRKGADVQREEHRKIIGEAVRPITGMTPDEFTKAGKRQSLPTKDRLECEGLDNKIQPGSQPNEVALYQARKRFKDLKC